MRSEKHREEKKKTWSYQRWGTIFPPPWENWQNSSRDKGVTAEENTWSHIGNYKVGRELKDGDPAWDLISFKIKPTLEYKHVQWHWSTIFPPSKPPFPVTRHIHVPAHSPDLTPLCALQTPLSPRLLQHEFVYPHCWEGRVFSSIFTSRITTNILLISPHLVTLILQLWM